MKTPSSRPPSDLVWQCSLLGGFILIRLLAIWHYRGDLSLDPDAYLEIARNLRDGFGFATGEPPIPNAFRPPLYPLLLVPVCGTDQWWARGLMNLAMAALTFFCLAKTCRHLGFHRWQTACALVLFTFDPLSVRYLAFSMTETVCALLIAALLALLTVPRRTRLIDFLTGVVFGLAVLSRPTFWAFGVLLMIMLFLAAILKGDLRETLRRQRLGLIYALLGTAVCVLPWVIRNQITLKAPIVMTTHGGYTLLLGNNSAFYREVVDQPWGTIWDGTRGPGQEQWYQNLNREAELAGATSELARDRWMSRKAFETIQSEPITFLRASLLKFTWFWNVGPHGPEAGLMNPLVLWGIRTFYALFWLGLLCGGYRIARQLLSGRNFTFAWLVPVSCIFSLTMVHLFYWSDARMRAPLITCLAIIAAYGFVRSGIAADASTRLRDSSASSDPSMSAANG
ncbi:hypothetical protein SH668x_001625 [Planctomicrobium sp. SH668]|uniref:hypothetical protein n=1 Tax=Planctomicrobium sp. SH668 TaxID=3448126 RepID=UPI003F5CBC30